ncbi:hypothetical protein [Streptacidiphilus cavernicola]|uniref:Uncharacterized protein n=1 Tax=Streptacidiphilus cavernicola TaxID=3342716 RepID=A0ABV6W5Q0_9ACTN
MAVETGTATRRPRRSRGRRAVGLALGSALLAVAGTCATAGTAQAADSYQRVSTVSLSGRTITLWLNLNNHQWHAEISGAIEDNYVHLDYTNNPLTIDTDLYLIASATVPSGSTYANTSDHAYTYARACGFVGDSDKCTGWYQP